MGGYRQDDHEVKEAGRNEEMNDYALLIPIVIMWVVFLVLDRYVERWSKWR